MPSRLSSLPASPVASRRAVVDLGSNSVRLVVFEGASRNPVSILNEKAVLRLGRGLENSGRLNPEGVERAVLILSRFHAIGRAMGADPFEVLATAAVRDASNGRDFVARLRERLPGVPIRVLSGVEEAGLSAAGLLCGIPHADGILADIGGGSLELVRLRAGHAGQAATLRLGVIRLSDRAGGDPARARGLADSDLSSVAWLPEGEGRDLYLVGGAWRALARIHLAQTAYPLNMVHHYAIRREEARDLADMVAGANRRALERLPGLPRRRLDDLPMAAIVLRRLLRATGAQRVVFSGNGLREGWYMDALSAEERRADPLIAAGRHYAERIGRDPALPPALVDWTDTLFPAEAPEARRLRAAACWMSDIGSRDHPEFRAEQAFLRVLRQPGVGLDHHARAFLALTVALRYEAPPDAPFLTQARLLLDPAVSVRAEQLGAALRLAYTLCDGMAVLLAGTALSRSSGRLMLHLTDRLAGAAEAVPRRLERLAETLGLQVGGVQTDTQETGTQETGTQATGAQATGAQATGA